MRKERRNEHDMRKKKTRQPRHKKPLLVPQCQKEVANGRQHQRQREEAKLNGIGGRAPQ